MALPNLSGSGRLTADPRVSYTKSGVCVCQINVAFNSRKQNQSGEWEDDKVLFLKAEAWREIAEALGNLRKGDEIVLYGRPETETWTTKEGESRSSVKLNIDAVGPVLREKGAVKATAQADPWGSAPVDTSAPF